MAGAIPIILPVGALPEAIELVPFEDPEEGIIDAFAVVLDNGDAPAVVEALGRTGRVEGVLRGEELAGLFGMAGTMPTRPPDVLDEDGNDPDSDTDDAPGVLNWD
jgi:hypothetical protein